MKIRSFKKSDSLSCSSLVERSILSTHKDHYTTEQITSLLKLYSFEKFESYPPNQAIYVAEKNNRVVGVGSILEGKIKGLYVDPEYFGQKVGGSLLGVLESTAKDNGFSSVSTYASLNALEFYKAAGYHKVSDHMDENGPAVVMTKNLCIPSY